MPAGGGDFWIAIAQDLRDESPRGYAKLRTRYPDGAGGVMHAFIATQRPASLPTLEALPTVALTVSVLVVTTRD
jgi:hypothetical protein